MSDDPFAAFKEGQPPADPPAADKVKKPRNPPKAGKKKAPGKPKPEKGGGNPAAVFAEATKPKKTRKPRQAKEMRLPISMLLEIGSLSGEESGALLSIGAGLQKLPKKSRGKITAALSKIFG